jgi:glycosyltransferase involved in cell wall biosynthesis
MMKILHVSVGDSGGGAARAACRIHRAQVEAGLDSRMFVLHRGTDDNRVIQAPPRPLAALLLQKLQCRWQSHARRGWSTENPVLHSFGKNSAGLVDELNASDADILNLHWISDMLSMADIGRLRKPVFWTLHDMWAFCGCEHYTPDGDDARFRRGYRVDNRPAGETGPDLNRSAWVRKKKAWKQPMILIGPSRWIADCARESILFRGWPVHCIPNPLDLERWRPFPKDNARSLLCLPKDKRIVLFGAIGGEKDPRKGADLLRHALNELKNMGMDFHLVVFGQSMPKDLVPFAYPVTYLGRLQDDFSMIAAYNSADVMVVPSRQEAFGQTASEAHACGVPVVAFKTGGLTDIVRHQVSGYLAEPHDVLSLAEGIGWVLHDDERLHSLGVAARALAERKFSASVVAEAYAELYAQAITENR